MSFKIHINNKKNNNNDIILPIKLFTGGSFIALDDYLIGAVEYAYLNKTNINNNFIIKINNKETIVITLGTHSDKKLLSLISLNIPVKKGNLIEITSTLNINFTLYLTNKNINTFKFDKTIDINNNDVMDELITISNYDFKKIFT